jgi:hypothetical protein
MTETLPSNYYMSVAPRVQDWAGVIDFSPRAYHAPNSLEELSAVLGSALHLGPHCGALRILGGMHSCSAIFQSDFVIDTSRLPLEFTVAPPAKDGTARVTASAFMHAHDFLARAAEHGLSLTALGGTDAQTLAGLIATNTSGATIRATVYETLAWVEYLTVAADGKTIKTRRVERGAPDFNGMIASLGAIGMMTRVAFDLVPQRFFDAGMELRSLKDTLGNLDAVNAQYDFWRIEWLPDNDDVGNFWWAKRIPQGDPNGDYPPDKVEGLLRQVISFDDKAFSGGPLLDPMLKAAYGMMISAYQPTTASGPMRNMIPVDRLAPIKVAMAEWSFAPADLKRAMDCCRGYFRAKGWPNLSIEIQCSLKDNYWMSPWDWPDVPESYIVKLNFQYITDSLSADEKTQMTTHLKGLWDALDAAGIRFKAHWGKMNFLDPKRIAALYQPKHFMPLVKPLFLNDYLKARLPL